MLRSGQFAVTAELNPPDSVDPRDLYEAALVLAGVVDAINTIDSSGANVHMSSLGTSALLIRAGYDVVMQISCRDRNRIALQADLLAASALGVKNVLCITGDDVSAGDQPEAKRVFDFDSMHLLRTARIMRDQGVFLNGRTISVPPRFLLGAVENPFAPPLHWRADRLAKKVDAGADFIQTQYVFDIEVFREFMSRVRDLGLTDRVYILAGVGPLKSPNAAEFMRARIPGVVIPDSLIERMKKTPREHWRKEGIEICIEIIQKVQELEGIAGIHVMAFREEETVAEIIHRVGLYPRSTSAQNPTQSFSEEEVPC
ncbi:MAG TPA: methylenetetrahydrofolate reductase [Anaerolineales bacterium]|nr:methylenetetrahydrofolate reductase [Anaerolineales bacterium]